MVHMFSATVPVLFVLVANEWWWRVRRPHDELSRKLVHILVGTFVAFWPYFLSWNSIRLLSLAFLVVVGASRYFHVFRAIHSVQRPTWGEIFFALAVGLTTYVTHSKGVYAAALLQMGLADGLAAIVGVSYGKGNDYRVFGQRKSLAGSIAFMVTSYSVLLGFSVLSGHIAIGWCLGLAILGTAVENISVHGLDNLLVPLLVATLLSLLV